MVPRELSLWTLWAEVFFISLLFLYLELWLMIILIISCWKNNSRTLKLDYSVTCCRFRIFIFRMFILNLLSRPCLVCTSSIGFSWCKTFFIHFITKFHHINIHSSEFRPNLFLYCSLFPPSASHLHFTASHRSCLLAFDHENTTFELHSSSFKKTHHWNPKHYPSTFQKEAKALVFANCQNNIH